jgi:formylglycine-generating enzyme required for sulfatase activity
MKRTETTAVLTLFHFALVVVLLVLLRPLAAAEPPALPGARALTPGKTAPIEWLFSKPAGIAFTRTEITVAQYRACADAGVCTSAHHRSNSDDPRCTWGYRDHDQHPMNCISGSGAEKFCAWAGGRLPTDEEWYAEASNKGSRQYPWGDEPVTCRYAVWGAGDSDTLCGKNSTWPVCSMPSGNSVSGLCDMSGNVWEWTSIIDGSMRVMCGGSWYDKTPSSLVAAARQAYTSENWYFHTGFRCARSPTSPAPSLR